MSGLNLNSFDQHRADADAADAGAGAICLVVKDFAYDPAAGGTGFAAWLLAHLLAEADWRVHVLYCAATPQGSARHELREQLAAAGIGLSYLNDFSPPQAFWLADTFPNNAYVAHSEWVRYALEVLDERHGFDFIEFAERDGRAFRAVQARRIGSALEGPELIVKLHGSSQKARTANRYWMGGTADMMLDYCERLGFEQADVQLAAGEHLFAAARAVGWDIRPNAAVVPQPLPEPVGLTRPVIAAGDPEIVYVGPLETAGGIHPFLDSIDRLPQLRVTFAAPDRELPEGGKASHLLATRLAGRAFIRLDLEEREALLEYLASGNRLAVIPTLAEDFPYAVVECALHGIPFLASRTGGAEEIITDPFLREDLLFEPTARDLARCLERYRGLDADERQALCERARRCLDVARNRQQIAGHYAELLAARRAKMAAPVAFQPPDNPLVTVAVPFYNLGQYLPDALASLAAQTYPNLEVLVINDGSTDPQSVAVFEQQRKVYPQFRFVTQPNAGLGATRNRALREARGEFFLPLDADNVAAPAMIERFVRTMQRRPEVSALTCYFLAFEQTADVTRGRFRYAYRPTCGPYVLACLANVFGDANALFRVEHLRAIGGYTTERDTTWEDWEAFVKLLNAGYQVAVVPEYLFYYRHLANSMSRATVLEQNHRRVLREFFKAERLSYADRVMLWTALVSYYTTELQLRGQMKDKLRSLRYRVADRINDGIQKIPLLHPLMKTALRSGQAAIRWFRAA